MGVWAWAGSAFPWGGPGALAADSAALQLGAGLDRLLADPASFPHPVVYMGRAIRALENGLRAVFPATPAGERWAGRVLALALPLASFSFGLLALACLARLHPLALFAGKTLWSWQVLALEGLARESRRVQQELERGDLFAARKAVARIVGRDTEALDEAGVARAAVETVAENAADGVIAPLFYLAFGGVPLALAYKAVNTMDSMVGYKNKRYLWFGRAAARLDDAANFVPSRLTALLWIAGAFAAGQNAKEAWRIWRRDRFQHASPNSGQTEAACAGALGLRLAGPASYFGRRVEKPTIGDEGRPIEPGDIARANQVLAAVGALGLALALLVRGAAALLCWR